MNEIQFTTRVVTSVSTEIALNYDYDEPFPEMNFMFDFPTANMSYSFIRTNSVESEWNIIKSLFELMNCKKDSEMFGKKIIELSVRVRKSGEEWSEWQFCGYGACDSDKFINPYGDGSIMKRIELEEEIREEINKEILK